MTICYARKTGGSFVLVKSVYFALLIGGVVLASVLQSTALNWSKSMGMFDLSIGCKNSTTFDLPGYNYSLFGADAWAYCAGDSAVYRVGLGLAAFFLMILTFCFFLNSAFSGFWILKIMALPEIMVGVFFVPENFFAFNNYQNIARGASVIFLVLQVLLLIDFGTRWNDRLVGFAEHPYNVNSEKGRRWYAAIIFFTVIFYTLAAIITGILFAFYAPLCSCSKDHIILSVALVAASSLISLFREKLVGIPGAILPSSIAAAYVLYLTWSSLESNPDPTCQPPQMPPISTPKIGFIIAAVSIAWACFRPNKAYENLFRGATEEEDEKEATNTIAGAAAVAPGVSQLYEVYDEADGKVKNVSDLEHNAKEKQNQQKEKKEEAPKALDLAKENFVLFFTIMISASFYMTMLLTNWGEASAKSTTIGNLTGNVSMWAKIIAAWIAVSLYIWTLIAPKFHKSK